MAVTKALHNDLLKVYIELGFVGAMMWTWYWIMYIPNFLTKKVGIRNALICFTLIIYSFITYATDNTAGYFNYQMHLSMIITAILSGYLKKGLSINGDK